MNLNKLYKQITPIAIGLLFVVVKSNAQQLPGQSSIIDSISISTDSTSLATDKVTMIINFGKDYLGKPYRYKTRDGRILDCSGFISFIYGHNGIALPRSSAAISGVTEKVKLSEVSEGDLMFFKGRNVKNKRVGHVSMVTAVNGDTIEMMHSCSKGIVVEKYNYSKYYKTRFLFAGRLPYLASIGSFMIDSVRILPDSVIFATDTLTSIVDSRIPAHQDRLIKNDSTIIDTANCR